jgi:hypothetical protein
VHSEAFADGIDSCLRLLGYRRGVSYRFTRAVWRCSFVHVSCQSPRVDRCRQP